jgi:mycothiol synthase
MDATTRPTLVDPFQTPVGFSAPPGVTFRHLRRPGDFPAMNEIANASRRAMGMDFTTTAEQLAEYYTSATRFDPDRDLAIVEHDGRLVGYARSGLNVEDSGRHVYEVVPFLDPALDPDAIYPAMLEVLIAHVRILAADDTAPEQVIQTFGGDSAPALERHVASAGFVPVRHGYSMVRPHVEDLPDSALPAGLEIRPVRPEDVRAIWDAATEALRDSWGFVEPDDAEYQRMLSDANAGQTARWQVAWDGDQVAGSVRAFINALENEQLGRKRGYTEAISVRRPWRRRGVARALIAASIRDLRAQGMTETALGVDTENVSGALRLYEACGYVPVTRTTTWEQPLAAGIPERD